MLTRERRGATLTRGISLLNTRQHTGRLYKSLTSVKAFVLASYDRSRAAAQSFNLEGLPPLLFSSLA